MEEVFLLTKVLFKSSKSNTKKTNTKLISKFFTFLVFLFVYSYLAGIIGYISYEAISSLSLFNKESIFLNFCFAGLLGFSIFQSIFTSLNVLFFSKDIESLLPLPIKPYKIIMAKFNCLVFSQYIMYFVVAVPMLTVYGYMLKMNVLYYIYSFLILLIFPIIPIVIVSLLLIIIMKFTNIIKNKETVQYITAFLTIIIIVLIQFLTGAGNKNITNEELAENLIQANSSIEEGMELFPNVRSVINTLNNYDSIEGIKEFSIFVFESAIVYLIVSFTVSKFYIKTVTSIMNNGTKMRKKKVLNKDYIKNKVWKSYLIKEIRTLVRNPIFFMQCVLPPFLFPLIFLIPSVIALLNQKEETAILINYLSNFINTPVILITSIEILELFYIFNFATITSISRDGSDAKVMKYLPIDLNKQLTYKSILGILFNVIPLIYTIVILKIGLKLENVVLIYIIVLGTIINIFNNYLVIIVDLKNPKTDWMTEYAVVKQNLNMFFQMLIIVSQMGLLFLGMKIPNLNMCFIVISLIFIILTIFIKKYINKNKNKLFGKIY